MTFYRRIILIWFISTILTACVSYDFSQRKIHQGNLLSQSKISKLHAGMHKDDVAILMGTSLISQTFNNNRWDYVYDTRKGGNQVNLKRVSLYFNHDVLTRIDQGS